MRMGSLARLLLSYLARACTRIVGLMGLEVPRAKWYFPLEASASLVTEVRHEAVPFLARPDYGHRGCLGR
jgi:hypothetical protein